MGDLTVHARNGLQAFSSSTLDWPTPILLPPAQLERKTCILGKGGYIDVRSRRKATRAHNTCVEEPGNEWEVSTMYIQ